MRASKDSKPTEKNEIGQLDLFIRKCTLAFNKLSFEDLVKLLNDYVN